MRLSVGRCTSQESENPVYKDVPNLDENLNEEEHRKRKRTSVSDGNLPGDDYSDDESEELEEGELTSDASSLRKKSSLSNSYYSRSVSDHSSKYSNGNLSRSEVTDLDDSHRRAIKSLLRSLPVDTHIEYTDQKKLSGVVPVSNYNFSKKIGEGSFGEVIIASNLKTRERVALKKVIVHKDTDGVPITALREIMILKSLSHENIISLREIALSQGSKESFTPGVIYMVFPYMEHDLAGLLDNPDVNLTPAQIKCYTKQLLEGIAYLHKKEILHRDMKSANVLVGDSGILKIADFGLARYYDKNLDSSELTPTVITVWYRPPELLLGSKVYTSAVDMWGVGCIFAELWDRKAIFAGQKEMDVLSKIFQVCGVPSREEWSEFHSLAKGVRVHPRPFPKRIYERFKNMLDPTTIKFIRYMFTYDPSRRPTAVQALKHEYFRIDPPPARRNTSDFPSWPDSHELGMRLARDKDGNPVENAHVSKSTKITRVHKDIVLDLKGRVIPRAKMRTLRQSPGQDSAHSRHSSTSRLSVRHNCNTRCTHTNDGYYQNDEPVSYNRRYRRASPDERRIYHRTHRSSPRHSKRHKSKYSSPHENSEFTEKYSKHSTSNHNNARGYRSIENCSPVDCCYREQNRSASECSYSTNQNLESGECRER